MKRKISGIKSGVVIKNIDGVNHIEYIDGRGRLVREELRDLYSYGFVEKSPKSRALLSVSDKVVDFDDGYVIRTRDGRDVECYKFELFDSRSMYDVRGRLSNEGLLLGECDILYWRRLCIDRSIEFDYCIDNVLYVDIEVDDSQGFPKEYGKYKILCIGAYDTKGRQYYFDIYDYSEEEMLIEFVELMKRNCYTIVSGWNVEFDYKHILERLREFRLWEHFRYFSLCQTFDLFTKYREVVKGLSSYSLEEVSKKEGYDVVKHREKKVSLMDQAELMKYNLYDVWLCMDIDRKYGFSIVDIGLSNFVNLPINEKSPVRIGDYTIINRLRELGNYVALTVDSECKEQEYEGALVLEPVPGVHKNVIYVDVNSLYPNVIINKNIDIDGFDGEVLPHLMRNFLKMRAEKKKMYKETGESRYNVEQMVYKLIANSLYGLLGLKYFRYYNPVKAGQVTGGGREVLMKMKRYLEDVLGVQVIYGDSVSKDSKILIRRNGVVEYVRIEELFDTPPDYVDIVNGKEYKILDGVETVTLDDRGGVVWRPVPYVMRHRVDKKMYRVHLVNGMYVDVTEDHSIYVCGNGVEDLVEVRPSDLTGGLRCVVLSGEDLSGVSCVEVEDVVEIEYYDYVYDIEVEDTHRFFANLVLVHNTDSEFVSLSNLVGHESVDEKTLIEVAEAIVDLINEHIHPYTVKLEDVFKKILFMKDESGRGIKKRYIAMSYAGKYYYRGIELRRSDYCRFAKDMMNRVIDWIMKDELSRSEIEKRLKEYKLKMYRGEYDEDLIIAKSITKEDYKTIPEHIRAYMIAKEMGYEFTDYRVKYVYVKEMKWNGETVRVWPVINLSDLKKLRLDYNRYWNIQVMNPVKRLLSALPDDSVKVLDDWFG